jgi:hypothetical protein
MVCPISRIVNNSEFSYHTSGRERQEAPWNSTEYSYLDPALSAGMTSSVGHSYAIRSVGFHARSDSLLLQKRLKGQRGKRLWSSGINDNSLNRPGGKGHNRGYSGEIMFQA